MTLYYYMEFQNDSSGHEIDFVDLGLPTTQYKLSNIKAEINGMAMPEVNDSAYVPSAELALGNYAIQPGESGIVTAWVYEVKGVLSAYDGADHTDYANFFFVPNYFGSEYERSQNTAYRMTIILPPAVGANEGIWYEPSGWPGSSEPEASLTTMVGSITPGTQKTQMYTAIIISARLFLLPRYLQGSWLLKALRMETVKLRITTQTQFPVSSLVW